MRVTIIINLVVPLKVVFRSSLQGFCSKFPSIAVSLQKAAMSQCVEVL